jgi:predicted metalloprotease with PDZ domain
MTMKTIPLAIMLVPLLTAAGGAQDPLRHFTDAVDIRVGKATPVISYTVTLNERDTTGFDVRMVLRNAPDTFRIAMAKHPEYDDRFFRYVENLRSGASVTISQQDSTVWRVVAPHGETVVIEYRIALPPKVLPRAAWIPFLSPRGGLTGGPHTFMYVVGAEQAPAHVELRVPDAWTIATGLTPTRKWRTFFAPNAYVLMESPILVGSFPSWDFSIDGVPHTIAYFPSATGVRFDTAAFRDGVERFANEAVKLFGRPPYREYIFQFQDDAWGGLEHHNSVTLGARSALLAENPQALLPETAHEFFHTWNLMRIRPAEYTGVTYRQIRPVPTLWFSEGLTIFYADLLTRRAGLPAETPTRTEHLASIISRYLSNPGQSRFSAEQISRVAYNAPPDALGDYNASSHLQGEVIGTMLDLLVRDASNGRRSMDDVMRLMLERGSSSRGFTTADIERAVADACECAVKPFFDAHVRGGRPIDFDRYLALIGLKTAVASEPATREGQPVPDHRLWAWNPPGDTLMSLLINNPESIWGKAGLHSGERVITINGNTVRTWPEFRQMLSGTRIGDVVHFVVKAPRASAPRTVTVKVSGYERPVVRIEEVFSATEKQLRLREAWLAGSP